MQYTSGRGEGSDQRFRRHAEGYLIGMRVDRYSWWVHWRELADFELPRRYKWLITPNQATRGSPINQHILDSTGTIAARNLASGFTTGVTPQNRPWLKVKIGRIDSTQTSPISIWLAEVERLLMLVFQESNFYTSISMFYFDLVVFGTAVLLIYEDFDNVINCLNPCLGEFYLQNSAKMRPDVFAREFVYTVTQLVSEFGLENCSPAIQGLYENYRATGSQGIREIIVGHVIEPNDPPDYGIDRRFKYREVYWEYGGSSGQQGGASGPQGILRKRGYYEKPHIACRWDLVSNDAYGRSPGMDALPDVKQLQHETRRKAQGIDKGVNPPLRADMNMKNQPASLIPGGVTYIPGMMQSRNPGFESVYGNWKPAIAEMTEDLNEVRERIRRIFFNDILMTASQYETRSNVTAVEWDMRKSESLVMLGPVLSRVYNEGVGPAVERTLAMMFRAGIIPPAPAEVQGRALSLEFMSMLFVAQMAAQASGIERLFQVVGSVEGVAPEAIDNVDVDYSLEKYSYLMNNDPRLIRPPAVLQQIRQQRQQQAQAQQRAEQAEKLAAAGKTMSETDVGGGQNALQRMIGAQ
jgi:hypothetical protein